ncbi:MAG TPA: hypothetical protein VG651_12140 [Stellaceae bacterium]|nr:hypothetical protein [Stellaceae bacterium]
MVVPTEEAVLSPEAPRRPPPKAFCILLPVWGESYVTQFLDSNLLTLLAPGNIPALAAMLPTRFVFLTRARDEPTIRAHRGCALLQAVCPIEFMPIDDLIMSGNHSTTITLGWERAVRRAGETMLDTCFVFLVSDYVMADGSLRTIGERMLAGADAIQAGNFQLSEETADAWLQEKLATARTSLSLAPREMVRWGLDCLHPATVANTVNYPLCHNSHTNRLFWRVDRDTLIGRFYLLHQICIRPERSDFLVGSASDYSFVPEMCPSGNVVILNDSDAYFVAEVQPVSHETRFICYGPNTVEDLAESLSEWTTFRHRLNARETIVFHASDLPASLPDAVGEADGFIARITPRLAPPQPYRNHPYWIGAVAALNDAIAERRRVTAEAGPVPAAASPPVAAARGGVLGLARRLRARLVGTVPYVSRVHPRRRDYRALLAACEAMIPPASRLLIEGSDSTGLGEALRQKYPDGVLFSLRLAPTEQPRPIVGIGEQKFDVAFIGLVNDDLSQVEVNLRRVANAMRPGGQVVLVLVSTDGSVDPDSPGQSYAIRLASLVPPGIAVKECRIATMGRARWWLNDAAARAVTSLLARRRKIAPLVWLRIALWSLPALLANIAGSYREPDPLKSRRVVSSVLMRFVVESAVSGRPPSPFGRRRPIALNHMARYANVFAGITPWSGRVPPGYLIDFCGVLTAAEFTNEADDPRFRLMVGAAGSGDDRPVGTRLPTIEDGEVWFEAVNWVLAASEAKTQFVMMTLGANYGAQAVCSYRILQHFNPMPCKLVAVEPVPENFARIQRHFRDNGLDPAEHWLVPLALAGNTAPVLFPVGATGSGAQNAIASNNDEARQGYVDALTEAGHEAAEAALRNLLLHNTTGLVRPLGKDIDLTAEIKLVSAMTLRELLEPFALVDYVESDIQQSEIEVFPPCIEILRQKVRRIHIGTHGADVHHALHKLFAGNGWHIVFSFAPNSRHETALGSFTTNDGVLTVLNPDL